MTFDLQIVGQVDELRQIFLQRLLGLPTPRYLHVPVATDSAGHKLSKATGAAALPAAALPALLAVWKFLEQPTPAERPASVADFWTWASANWRPLQLPRVAMRPAPPDWRCRPVERG